MTQWKRPRLVPPRLEAPFNEALFNKGRVQAEIQNSICSFQIPKFLRHYAAIETAVASSGAMPPRMTAGPKVR